MAAQYLVPSVYSTIGAALSAIPTDLSGQGVQDIIISAGTYNEPLTVNGFSNADASNYIKISPAVGSEHGGVYDTGVVIDYVATQLGYIYTDYTHIVGVCFKGSKGLNTTGTSSNVRIDRCMFNMTDHAIRPNGTDPKIICCGIKGRSGKDGIFKDGGGVAYLYNNVIHGTPANGTIAIAGSFTAYNNVSVGATTACFANVTAGDNNYSEDGTAFGVNAEINQSIASMKFLNYAGDDLHVQVISPLNGGGVDQSSVFTEDIDDQTVQTNHWPVGFDFVTPTIYTDLSLPSTGGAGTTVDPLTGADWWARVKQGGTGVYTDSYKMKGSYTNTEDTGLYLFDTMEAWDLTLYGHYRLQFNKSNNYLGSSPDPGFRQKIKDLNMNHSGRLFWGYVDFYNTNLFATGVSAGSRLTPVGKGDAVAYGCTLTSLAEQGGANSVTLYNTVLYEQSTYNAGGNNTYNFYNCVIPEASMAAFVANLGATAGVDSGNQYSFIPNETQPEWDETDYNNFAVDSAVTINGSGTYTGYETGMFGNTRPATTATGYGAGIGASFFPYQLLVDVAGSKDYTELQAAIDAIPDDMSGFAGYAEVVTLAGDYPEMVTITGFTNLSASKYIKLSVFPGSEHGGIFGGTGVRITGSHASTAPLVVDADYTEVRDIEVQGQQPGQYGLYTPATAENITLERVLADGDNSTSGIGFDLRAGGTSKMINFASKSWERGVYLRSDSNNYALGGVVYNTVTQGIQQFSGTAHVHNCVSYNPLHSNDFSGTLSTKTGNVSGDNSASTHPNSKANMPIGLMNFVNVGTDFHVSAGSSLIGLGTDQSAHYTTDIDGEAIPSTDYAPGFDYKKGAYLVGSTRTYLTPAAALAQLDTDVSSDMSGIGVREIVIDAGTYAGFDEPVLANTSASDYVLIRATGGSEHKGIPGAGVYINTRVRLYNDYTSMYDTDINSPTENALSVAASNVDIKRSMFRSPADLSGQGIVQVADGESADFTTCVARNTNGTLTDGDESGFRAGTGSVIKLSNCVAYGFKRGFDNAGAEAASFAKACVADGQTWTSQAQFTSFAIEANNFSSDATGGGNVNQTPADFDFVNASAGDFHIGDDSKMVHEGGDQSATSTVDIDGATIFGGHPVGIDQNQVSYVNMGSDVDANAGSASGNGSRSTPYNARAMFDRVETGSNGNDDDIYYLQGSSQYDFTGGMTRVSELRLWKNGPWKIKSIGLCSGFPSASDGLIETTLDGGSGDITPTAGVEFNNMSITGATGRLYTSVSITFNGCTISTTFGYLGTGTVTMNDSIVTRNIIDYGLGTHILNCNNTAFENTKAELQASNFTVTDASCQFQYVPSIAEVTYADTDYNLFIVDPNITINGNGTYTGYENGLFGNPRPADNEISQGAGIGASFFPLQKLVDVVGSKDFTLIQAAIDDIPSDFDDITGDVEVIVKAGTYPEDVVINNFSNVSASKNITLRPFSGDENDGLISTGVIIVPPTLQGIFAYTDHTKIKDIGFDIQAGKSGINTIGSSSDVDVVNCVFNAAGAGSALRLNGTNPRAISCSIIGGDLGIYKDGAGVAYVYGCSIADSNEGVSAIAGSFEVHNTVSACVTTDFSDVTAGDYNASTDATAFGGNSLINQSLIDIDFINKGTGDLHIGEDSVLLHAGSDQSGVYTTDIDGDVISDGYPIGIDNNLVYYVDLDQVATGVGSIADPVNTTQFWGRVNDLGGSLSFDTYIMKGTGSITFNANEYFTYYKDIKSWDLGLYGPWQLNADNASGVQYLGNFRNMSEQQTMSDGVLQLSREIYWGVTRLFNMNIKLLSGSLITGNATHVTKVAGGCSITGLKNLAGSDAVTLTDCVFYNAADAGSNGSSTINSTACVFPEATYGAFLTSMNSAGPSSACQFSFVPASTQPGFEEASANDHLQDTAITIPGTANYLNYPTGLFNQDRLAYEAATGIGPIGAFYFVAAVEFENSTPSINSQTEDGAVIDVQIDQNGNVYLVVVANGATTPTSSEVKAGTGSGGTGELFADSIALTASVGDSITITGLTPEDYDIYVVAENASKLQPIPVLLNLDIKKPDYASGSPRKITFGATEATIGVETNENGHTWSVLVANEDTPPSIAQIKAGQNSASAPAIDADDDAMTADVEVVLTLGNIDSDTDYDVYVYSEDVTGNGRAPVRVDLNRLTVTKNTVPVSVITDAEMFHRAAIKLDVGNFHPLPGLWAVYDGNKLESVTTGVPGVVHKFPISVNDRNQYTSHDIKSGRLTVLSTPGVRVTVNLSGYVEGISQNDELIVSIENGEEGKLRVPAGATPGTYEIVARCETINNDSNTMTWSLASPKTIVVT